MRFSSVVAAQSPDIGWATVDLKRFPHVVTEVPGPKSRSMHQRASKIMKGYSGQPWKTQEVVTRIAKESFWSAPDGIPANDDLGATSGVFLWVALGFYPAVPGVGFVVLGTPMFDKVTLHLADNRTVVVSRRGSGIYVRKLTLDGLPYSSSWLPHAKLHPGLTQLEFTVDQEPNRKRGKAFADRPPVIPLAIAVGR